MLVLGSWAALNILSGAAGSLSSSGRLKYFHQMNAGWNLVNLAIAGGSLYSLSQADLSSMDAAAMFSDMNKLDKFLLLNSGLDVGYIAAGAWLWDRGLRKGSDRLVGYGRSLIVQGSFLLVFDAVVYALHSPLTKEFSSGVTFQIAANTIRISF